MTRQVPLHIAVRLAMAVDLRAEHRTLSALCKREAFEPNTHHKHLLDMASTLTQGKKLDAAAWGMRSYVDLCVRTCQDFGCTVEETDQILANVFDPKEK